MNKDKLVKDFREFLEKRHLKDCSQCQKEGKARIMDCEAVALSLFKEFIKEYDNS